jgi:hypothetical protein
VNHRRQPAENAPAFLALGFEGSGLDCERTPQASVEVKFEASALAAVESTCEVAIEIGLRQMHDDSFRLYAPTVRGGPETPLNGA